MKKIIKNYIIKKSNNTHIQFIRYLFAGGFATIIDMAFFYLTLNILNFHYIIAQTVGFFFGLLSNYLICIIWIFERNKSKKIEFILFVLIGLGGLLWSYLILWLLIDILKINYFQNMFSKSISIILVLIWNFLLRKKFAFN